VPSLRRAVPVVCQVLLLVAAGRAQAPAAWASLSVPTGVAAADLLNLGKVVGYRDGSRLHAWSAVTRTWQGHPRAGIGTTRVFNDCVLTIGPGAAHAFSSMRGAFASVAIGPTATLRNGTTNQNDSVLLVGEGATLHAFSSFVGTWTSRTFPGAPATAVLRHTALAAFGTMLCAYDAFTGTWHDLTVPAVPWQLSVDGTAGFAEANGTVHAFSAVHGVWSTRQIVVGAALVRGDDYGVWIGGGAAVGYSSLQNEWAAAGSAGTTAAPFDLFAVLDTPAGKRAFSACTARWSPVLASAGAVVVGSGCTLLLQDAAGVSGWSAVNDRRATLPGPSFGMQAAGAVGSTLDAGNRPVLWSSLTGTWHHAPGAAQAGPASLTTTCAAVGGGSGVFAFDARTSTFVLLDTPGIAWSSNPSSAPLIAWDATNLWAFEARTGRWLATPRSGTGTPNVGIWRTCALVVDGATAYGFGAPAGQWAAVPLPGPVLGTRVNSESVRVHTQNHVLAFPAIGEIVPQAQFPEFRRVQAAGAPLDLVLAVPANGFALLGIGPLGKSPTPIPGFGDLLLATMVAPPLLVAGSTTGEPVTLHLPPAVATALRGSEWGLQAAMLQAAILPPLGTPWLTAAATIWPL
jgi:hypothetical protein